MRRYTCTTEDSNFTQDQEKGEWVQYKDCVKVNHDLEQAPSNNEMILLEIGYKDGVEDTFDSSYFVIGFLCKDTNVFKNTEGYTLDQIEVKGWVCLQKLYTVYPVD